MKLRQMKKGEGWRPHPFPEDFISNFYYINFDLPLPTVFRTLLWSILQRLTGKTAEMGA